MTTLQDLAETLVLIALLLACALGIWGLLARV